MTSKGKKWQISDSESDEVKDLILSYNATEDDTSKSPSEVWRLRIGKSVFTLYTSGTLFNNQATSTEVYELREKLDNFSTFSFIDTGKEIKIGLDETGKGELFGHEVLCGVRYPNSLSKEIEEIVGLADTKSRKSFEYWDDLFSEFDTLQGKGMAFVAQTIPPWHIDKYHTNKIMDIVYKKIISEITRDIPLDKTSIVIDDYRLEDNLNFFLNSMTKKGVQVEIAEKADEKYLEAKLASVLAKREREKMMRGINERFKIDGIVPGTGNLTDPNTQEWLRKWKTSGQEWPWFVKKSVKTIQTMDGKFTKVRKVDPPIRHDLLSNESKHLFDEGKLSSASLRLSCPECGTELKAVKLTPDQKNRLEGRCIECSKVISDLKTTLFYYNGNIVPDSSAILSGILSKDLTRGKFFENFTILLTPRVLEECDNQGGKAELGRISDIANVGRIRQITLEDIIDYDIKADDEIVTLARKNNAIILTKDRGQYAKATGFDVFVLTT
ncbi:MAG: hypothetical protein GWN01_13575 [Nitrosopumilaceae archaeon]|nr:hypothetical protein [Nitrosopumilaceae archaeon]NIU01894.1 hypothetical protein [Nitrosopumilaceae archaeon]NIU88298.1 hypothetical protein [Nitrosopumilaceae archaeon]NIV66590.1 hypothetical protein [Nitrosopumilaceae archaeon]NIX62495.1 hypothetical protein [Nitrosopumilaceae archaeon]